MISAPSTGPDWLPSGDRWRIRTCSTNLHPFCSQKRIATSSSFQFQDMLGVQWQSAVDRRRDSTDPGYTLARRSQSCICVLGIRLGRCRIDTLCSRQASTRRCDCTRLRLQQHNLKFSKLKKKYLKNGTQTYIFARRLSLRDLAMNFKKFNLSSLIKL